MKTLLLSAALTGLGLAARPGRAQAPAPLPVVPTNDALLNTPGGVRYLDAHWVPLPGAGGAAYLDQYRRIDSVGLNWQLRRYALGPPRQLVLEQFFTGVLPALVLEGPSREFYPDGARREELAYHKNRFAGTLRTYYHNGQERRVQAFGRGGGVCHDSLGRPLAKCPEYHTFARFGGKNTYSGKFLNLVQQGYATYLPAGLQLPAGQVVYYAFRIDPAGRVREPRLLTAADPALESAILRAITQLPAFEPATYEGQPTDDVVEGFVRVARP